MSIQLIQQYHNKVERLIRYGGTRKDTTVRKPFMDLLEQYARPQTSISSSKPNAVPAPVTPMAPSRMLCA